MKTYNYWQLAALFIIVAWGLILLLVFWLSGCCSIAVERTLPDGSVVKGQYNRWMSQEIDGFSMITPEGYEIKFDRHKSDVEIALEYAGAKASVGGSD